MSAARPQQRALDALEAELQTYFTDDWNFAYRRVGAKMEVEYHARQASICLRGLLAELKNFRAALAATDPDPCEEEQRDE